MGARVYIAELGRFLQIDTVEGGTLNRYVYAQDPVNQKDLSGKCVFFAVVVCIAILIAVGVASASKTLQDNPQSTSAWIGMGLATSGVGSVAGSVGAAGVSSAGASGASRVASTSAAKAAQSRVSQIAINRTNGIAAEERVFQSLQAKFGPQNVVSKPTYWTPSGYRYPDFQIYPTARTTLNIEVKSGNAAYGGLQAQKDIEILNIYGIETQVIHVK